METNNKIFDVASFIYKELRDQISLEERAMLEKWLSEDPSNRELYDKIKNGNEFKKRVSGYNKFDKTKAWGKINPYRKNFTLRSFLKYAAIVIPIVIALSLYFVVSDVKEVKQAMTIESIIPGQPKARLILSDNREITFEKGQQNIQPILEKGVTITNTHNSITYTKDESEIMEGAINTLEIPRGGMYSLYLSDGTKVWLNSDSKLEYPAHFNDSVRKVHLTGEAFFKVTHNGTPFIVETTNSKIHVLGTSFNVLAYPVDNYSITTLVTGKVSIKSEKEDVNDVGKILKSGEQAQVVEDRISVKEVDTKIHTAWIDGKFVFSSESLDSVLKKLSRWYNFDFKFKNDSLKNIHFSGRLDRNEEFKNVIEVIEIASNVKFEMINNELIVK